MELVDENILTLGMRADQARRTIHAGVVYYQRVHAVRLLDVQVGITIPEPATEVRVLETPAGVEDALRVIRVVKEAAGSRPVRAFSLHDVVARSQGGWRDLGELLARLAGAGMSDFADMPVDLLDDLNAHAVLARAAGLRADRLTVANPVTDRESEILQRIRRCQRDIGGLVRVNPLPRRVPIDKPTTGYQDVRMVALARLTLHELADGAPVFIEVDWSLYGPKLAQVALTFGADFLDAVSATTDDSLGPRRSTVEDVERNIRAAGYEPQEFLPSA